MRPIYILKSIKYPFVIVCLLLLCQAIPVRSQSDTKISFLDKLSIGVRGGVNFPTMTYSDPFLANYQSSLMITPELGAFVEIDLSRHISIRPEFMYIGKGQTIDEQGIWYEFSSDYFDWRLPIILNFCNPKGVRPYLMVAPVMGFAAGGTISLDDGYDKWKIDITDASIFDVELSVLAGAGIKIPIKLGKITLLAGVEAAYGLGLTDTYSLAENEGTSNGLNWNDYEIKGTRKNQGWQATASIAFPFSNFKRKAPKPVKQKPVQQVPVPQKVEQATPPPTNKSCYTIEEINELIDAKKSVNSKVICMNNLNFEFNKSTLDKESKTYLNNVVKLLDKVPAMKMKISGHTDNVGTDEYNKELSKKRAAAVYDYISSKGISTSRLSYEYYGSTRPLEANDSDENRAKNRRVEFEIMEK
jgi:outer membrane protein OmpA-like peptidoglycan-associated protein